MINVLIADDSAVTREYLKHLLNNDDQITVVGMARNGDEAVALAKSLHPNVIVMDVHMPGLNGIEATRKILAQQAVPIIIVSAEGSPEDIESTFHALDAGAVTVLAKPFGLGHPQQEASAREFISAVRVMSEVKVIRRWRTSRKPIESSTTLPPSVRSGAMLTGHVEIVAIGASTGGPYVLKEILSGLPSGFRAPILIVQHITPGFLPGLIEWLSQSCALPIRIAAHGMLCEPGHVYFAPDYQHMCVERGGRITLHHPTVGEILCPSVSQLFRSVALTSGDRAVGVLLTGMGEDGAADLLMMRERGAITVAQDKESAVVFGMPGKAIMLGSVTHVLSPPQITKLLVSLASE